MHIQYMELIIKFFIKDEESKYKFGGIVMKVITLCGSLRYKKEMMVIAEKMALEGNCILTPVYPVLEDYDRTDEQLTKLKEAHFKRIELSDAILVVNISNYVGESTNSEIEYAKKLNKEIIYYTDLMKSNQNDKLQVVAQLEFKIWVKTIKTEDDFVDIYYLKEDIDIN